MKTLAVIVGLLTFAAGAVICAVEALSGNRHFIGPSASPLIASIFYFGAAAAALYVIWEKLQQ